MLSRRLRADEDGLTLIELLVVMVILGIVGTVAMMGMINGMQATDRVDRRVEALTELQRNAERITRELRGGLTSHGAPADDGCVVMPLNDYDTQLAIQRTAERLRFSWSLPTGSSTLTESVARWDAATSSWVAVSSRPITTGLQNRADGVPVFTYLDRDGDPTTTVADVRKVRLLLRRTIPKQSPVELTTTVALRNGGLSCPSV